MMNINDLQKSDWVMLSTYHMSDYQELFGAETRDDLFYAVHTPRQITNIQRAFNCYSSDRSCPYGKNKIVKLDGIEENIEEDQLEPIEITDELLRKNGFQHIFSGGYVIPYFEYNDVRLIYDIKSNMYTLVLLIKYDGGSTQKEPISEPFKYFHELQHYLRGEASLRQNDDFIFDEQGNFLFDKEFTLIL